MISARALVVTGLGLVVTTGMAQGQGGSRYREFQLGGDLASVTALIKVAPSEAKTVHERPAILKDLQWRLPYSTIAAITTDPVQEIGFSFYNDQLYRLVIDYNRDRTEGLTDADMIEAISAQYGPVAKVDSKAAALSALEVDSGKRLAHWGDADFSVDLYRSSYLSGVRLIVASVPLGALARTAAAQALRLDEREAPQRDIARLKKESNDAEAVKQKARLVNKPAFRP